MIASPDRIRHIRDVTTMAALDTAESIIERIQNLISHGRRITTARRLTYADSPPEVTAGLTVAEIRLWTRPDVAGIEVRLKPGLAAGFGIFAHAGESDTEKDAATRYHAYPNDRRDLTRVRIVGGLPGDGPARDDLIIIWRWNSSGVCNETVVAFDYGPDEEDQP